MCTGNLAKFKKTYEWVPTYKFYELEEIPSEIFKKIQLFFKKEKC